MTSKRQFETDFGLYEVFRCDKPIYSLCALLSDKRIPLSTAMSIKQRVRYPHRIYDDGNFWEANSNYTSDLVAYMGEDKLKIILTVNSKEEITDLGKRALELMQPSTQLYEGLIPINLDIYKSFKGPGVIDLKRSDLGRLETSLDKEDMLNNKLWRIFARHPEEVPSDFSEDPKLLSDYCNLLTDNSFVNSYRAAISLAKANQRETLTANFIGWIQGGSNLFLGRDLRDWVDSYLIGKKPK